MKVCCIPAFLDNYIWGIMDDTQKTIDCVDPGDAEPVIHFLRSNHLKLRTILLTHHHHDHIGGVDELSKLWPHCLIYAPEDQRIPIATNRVKLGQTITIGPLNFKVMFNPGHTSSHISYYEDQKEWLFCGDTLFSAGCGRVFDGTIEELHQSMQLFKSLPTSTKIYCAHEYTLQNLKFAHTVEPNNREVSTYLSQIKKNKPSCTLPSILSKELAINPFLRTQTDEVKLFASQHGARSLDSLEVFKVLRHEKNNF
ncbi:hydroxyacylglutathione hydrolase [Legionella waltersii]|uniref:Hydroxyacylglutathione hydrolase n=1 Tax=Legionella waltersii TaxID=66969 RepID=A0A0W1AMA1_9GAMM|nr:hydroxyacylglutathione hydrolase [Legionella waltersii]KTD82384.1 hydroxyacylglutathione hydrolase (glyoxalase II) [Legionella waltersii]SNV03597.1 hydroxyacylglutathione hydrolase [Legionella waltersii]